MKDLQKNLRNFQIYIYRMVKPLIDPVKLIKGIGLYISFFCDWVRYSNLEGRERISIFNIYPCIHNKTRTTPFDPHYFYQDIWAFKKIYASKMDYHVDVGSRIDFAKFLTAIAKVDFIDIRPLQVNLENFNFRKGSVLSMPFEDGSIRSLSCLHVAEHIGLGRYGDPLDPFGTKKACRELARILAPNGNLYFSVPVGRPRLCFNAHRIHSPRQIIEYFNDLELVELSGIDDQKNFIQNIDIPILENSNYACGLFQFTKR